MVVQELSERDHETCPNLSRDILPSIPPTSVTICSDEASTFSFIGDGQQTKLPILVTK